MNYPSNSLWRERDFALLWTAATASNFGSMVRRIAVPLVAILVLDAGPAQLAILALADTVPGFLFGLWAGLWSDHRRRRPILIACDWGRALLLSIIPITAVLGALRMEILYVVVFAAASLGALFGVAHRSYLPSLLPRERLIEANGKLSAGASAAEATAFPIAGWLVQLLGAPLAVLVDALSFAASALFLAGIRKSEPEPAARGRGSRLRQIAQGFGTVLRSSLLGPLNLASALKAFSFSLLNVTYLLFVTRDLGFQPGPLGLIFALGSVSSVVGASLAERAARAIGVGPAILVGWTLGGLAVLLLPLAPAAIVLGAVVLSAHQILGDGPETVANVNVVSLIQAITPADRLGRVNGSFAFTSFAAQLAGAGLAGITGEVLGLRPVLVLAGVLSLAAGLLLFFTEVRRVVGMPLIAASRDPQS